MYASAAEERAERSQSALGVNGMAVVARITRLSIDVVLEGESIILCAFWCQRGEEERSEEWRWEFSRVIQDNIKAEYLEQIQEMHKAKQQQGLEHTTAAANSPSIL